MGRYKFTIHECGGAETVVGVDRALVGKEDIHAAAVEIARGVMAREIGQGRLCLTCWIVVTDEHDHNVLTLHFGDAVHMVEHDTCSSTDAPGT